jgi:hypothetical protein
MNRECLRLLLGFSLLTATAAPAVRAEQAAEDWELLLSGAGISGNGFDSTALALSAQVGWFMNKALEFGIRQNIGLTDDDTTLLNGATRLFVDYHFDYREWQPFVGASLGGVYGGGVKSGFLIGPEIGLKWYALDKTFIAGQIAYLFNVDQDIDDGDVFYSLGIGFNF